MCILCEEKEIKNIERLEVCEKVKIIPHIQGLQKLICYSCPLITSIPHIEGLQKLICHDCPLLTSIPHIEGLRELNCSYCPLLTSIPHIEGLRELNCSNCPWINPSQERMVSLVLLQKWWKRNFAKRKNELCFHFSKYMYLDISKIIVEY